jgi:hypothetical protein
MDANYGASMLSIVKQVMKCTQSPTMKAYPENTNNYRNIGNKSCVLIFLCNYIARYK